MHTCTHTHTHRKLSISCYDSGFLTVTIYSQHISVVLLNYSSSLWKCCSMLFPKLSHCSNLWNLIFFSPLVSNISYFRESTRFLSEHYSFFKSTHHISKYFQKISPFIAFGSIIFIVSQFGTELHEKVILLESKVLLDTVR